MCTVFDASNGTVTVYPPPLAEVAGGGASKVLPSKVRACNVVASTTVGISDRGTALFELTIEARSVPCLWRGND